MSVHLISADEALERLAEFDAVIDARSEAEYAEDRLPGALNWPSLDNDERHQVGTIYKQVSPFEARKIGASLVMANIARHIQREVLDKPKIWKPLLYCWRGGQRSGAFAWVLGQIGFRVHVVEGGYKAFRNCLLAQLPALASGLSYRVICGPTGSGKTRLLHALQNAGAQVLDLEGLACHRSSVLGSVPGQAQPSQKRFDTLLWQALRGFDAGREVYVECESRKVGNVAVPQALMDAIRSSPCIDIRLCDDERVALLTEDYAHFVSDPEQFCGRLEALVQLRGREQVKAWQEMARSGDVAAVFRELLLKHYDPSYSASIQRNFSRYADAQVLELPDRGGEALARAARSVIASQR